MKFLDNYLKKRIKELDEHPELNKNGKISQNEYNGWASPSNTEK